MSGESWSIRVDGDPRPWQRTRTRDGRHFDSRDNRLAKEAVLSAWRNLGVAPFPREAILDLDAAFYFRRPKSHYGTGRNANVLKGSAPAFHSARPDADNLVKLVKDALNGFAWHDDAQIATASVAKVYVDGDGPHARITVCRIGP